MIGLHENANIPYNIERADYIWRRLNRFQTPEKGIWRFIVVSYSVFEENAESMK